MRGRKAGFLPMRGKKTVDNYSVDDYIDLDNFLNGDSDAGADDDFDFSKRASFMPMRGKKAFHAMRGKKAFNGNYPLYSIVDNNMDKRTRAFFGTRG